MESLIGERLNEPKQKSANQTSVFQNLEIKRENFKESEHFQGLNIILDEHKDAETIKTFKLPLTARELERIVYFNGFVIKKKKNIAFIFFLLVERQLIHFGKCFGLFLLSVFRPFGLLPMKISHRISHLIFDFIQS